MTRIRFPVAEGGSSHFPTDPLCPICRETRVLEPHDAVVLSGGAAPDSGHFVDGGFLHIYLHSHQRNGAEVEIVRDTTIGQFDLSFCSTHCLRRFLNECVDELDRRINQHVA
jgi:hypothetical protein